MKVLYIHELYPPEIVGGGEIYAETLVTQLKKRGINVMVLTGTKGRTRTGIRNGIKVKRIHFNSRRDFMFKTKEIEKVIEKFKPDIVHTNAFTACVPSYFAARKHGIPVVVNLHFLFQKEYFRYHPVHRAVFFTLMEKSILKLGYDKIIALSYEIFVNLKKMGLKRRSVLIEHPINTKLFKPTKKPKQFTVGSSITIEPSKRLDLFIDLAKKMRDVRFITYGAYTPEMKKEFDKCGIEYVGKIEHKDTAKQFKKMHVLFGHGLAAKDAMASGSVAILNEPTIRLLRYHRKELKAGVMLKGDPVKIIKKLMKNKSYYNRFSKKSAKFIRDNYSTDLIVPKIIKLYRKMIK